jgi:hypothetical protein
VTNRGSKRGIPQRTLAKRALGARPLRAQSELRDPYRASCDRDHRGACRVTGLGRFPRVRKLRQPQSNLFASTYVDQVPQTSSSRSWRDFVRPTGLGNRAGILPGVDFRGQAGYVVTPPSVHPSGHRYRWINPCFDDLASARAWLMKLLSRSVLSTAAKNSPTDAQLCAGSSSPLPRRTGYPQRSAQLPYLRARPARRRRRAGRG